MEIKTTLYPDTRSQYNQQDQILTIMSSGNRFELKVHPMILQNIIENLNKELNQNDE